MTESQWLMTLLPAKVLIIRTLDKQLSEGRSLREQMGW